MEHIIEPKDRREETAVFRSQVIGPLARRDLVHGELRAELRQLSEQAFRPPGAQRSRCFSVATLERWLYAWRRGGLEALKPRRRSDRGRARRLPDGLRQLVLDIRREHPSVSVAVIRHTLEADGRLQPGSVSDTTLRRLLAEHGLDRVSLARARHVGRQRLRWQAEQPNVLWHGDVCHGPTLTLAGARVPLRIHGLLDDASRRIIALEAHPREREVDLLELLVRALRRHGRPDALYLDNGSTYRGQMLATVCARLHISLLHARPYDPQARGKMERFWRTLRQECLDFLGDVASLHDVNVRLWAFLDQLYHRRPHAGLMGRSPEGVYAERQRQDVPVDETALRDAFTARSRRRVRRDSTLGVDGLDFEVDAAFLAGRLVTVGHCLLDRPAAPWIEHEDRRYPLRTVDPCKNARRPRAYRPDAQRRHVPFDPPTALLDRAVGRRPAHAKEVQP